MRALSGLLAGLLLSGCTPARQGGPALDHEPPLPDAAVKVLDLGLPPPAPPDLGASCGAYSAYRARTEGVVRSPCDYDVARILSLGGDVKTRLRPPAVEMEFPDGTRFTGTTDGKTLTATRYSDFPFTDGCIWQARETLTGIIDESDCTIRATYAYREAPLSRPPCARPCTIDAMVTIERVAILVE